MTQNNSWKAAEEHLKTFEVGGSYFKTALIDFSAQQTVNTASAFYHVIFVYKTQSHISIHLKSCLCPPGECTVSPIFIAKCFTMFTSE